MASSLAKAFRDDEYRKFLILLLLAGAAASCCLPLASLFFVTIMGVSLATAGVITVAGLCGMVIIVITGRLSDRAPSRMPIARLAAAWLCVGCVAFSLAQSTWQAVVIYALFLSALGAVNAQIFACVRDSVTQRAEQHAATVTSTLRAVYTFGFVLGPLIGTAIATLSGLRAVFVVAAVLYAAIGLMTFTIDRQRTPPATEAAPHPTAGPSGARADSTLPIVMVAAGIGLVLTGDYLRSTYLSLHVVEGLDNTMAAFGTLIAVAAVMEVVALPVLGLLADRFDIRRVIAASLVVGCVDYAILAMSQSMWHVYVSQILHVVVLGAVYGLGMTYIQSLAAARVGVATSAFFSAKSVANPASGMIGAVTVGSLGLPGLFWIPAALCLGCVAGFVFSWRRRPITRARLATAQSPAT